MPTLLTPAQIIDIAKLSQMYAGNAIAKGSLFSPELSPKLARILYVERRSLQWMYNLSPTNTTLQNVANYVYRLCGRFGLRAIAVLGGGAGGGTIITPVRPTQFGFSFEYLIPITAADFATATDYNDSRIAGKQLEVFWKNIPNYQTPTGWQLIYTPSGFTVFVNDGTGGNAFNAFTTNSDAIFDIYIVHPTGTTVTPTTGTGVITYQGIGGETEFNDDTLIDKTILMVFRGTPYGIITSWNPGALEAKFLSATGEVIFNAGNPILSGELVFVLYV